MSDPFHVQDSNATCDYNAWFLWCEQWWDYAAGEDARDWSHYPWEQWYASGLTVDQAVRLAHRETFGGEMPI